MSAKTTPVDAVHEAFDNAPIGEPLTADERTLLVEAHADIAAGRLRTPEQITAAIESMLRRQEERG